MNEVLQEMVDHYQITKVLSEYCRGCDRLDRVQMANVYFGDSWDDHGSVKCPGPEYAAIATGALGAVTNSCSHQLGQSLVTVVGDDAGAETFFVATLRTAAKEGGETLNQIGGRFVDTLIRVEGNWKIKHRVCVRDWSISVPIKEDFLKDDPYVQGQRSAADPSYAVLRMEHSGLPDAEEIKRAAAGAVVASMHVSR
jgi:SnoaL-like domain